MNQIIKNHHSKQGLRIKKYVDKKLTTTKIPHRNGALLVKICGAVMEYTCGYKDHEATVNIRRKNTEDQ